MDVNVWMKLSVTRSIVPGMDESYTSRTLKALGEAVEAERDFPGWLAGVLARVAASQGSSYALIRGREGSWEASLVTQLVCGLTGWDDAYLADYAATPAGRRTGHPGTGQPPPG